MIPHPIISATHHLSHASRHLRLTIAKMMSSLTYNLILRVVLFVSLYLTYHRNVILHADVIIRIKLMITLLDILRLDIHQINIWRSFAAIFFREVEVEWCS